MKFYIEPYLDPNHNKNRFERFLEIDWVQELVVYIHQQEPILREILKQFSQVDSKLIHEVIELLIKHEIIIRANRRYYTNVPVINNSKITAIKEKYAESIRQLQVLFKKLNLEKRSPIEYYLLFGEYLHEHLFNLTAKKTLKYALVEEDSLFWNFKCYQKYKVKNYSFASITQFQHQNLNWLDYFINANLPNQLAIYENIRNDIGDVNPDYFLEHVLSEYKKLKRRDIVETKEASIYLNAAVQLQEVEQIESDTYRLAIPFFNKAEVTAIKETFFDELDTYFAEYQNFSYQNILEVYVIINEVLQHFPLGEWVIYQG